MVMYWTWTEECCPMRWQRSSAWSITCARCGAKRVVSVSLMRADGLLTQVSRSGVTDLGRPIKLHEQHVGGRRERQPLTRCAKGADEDGSCLVGLKAVYGDLSIGERSLACDDDSALLERRLQLADHVPMVRKDDDLLASLEDGIDPIHRKWDLREGALVTNLHQ